MGKSQQRKGKGGELELANYFNNRGYDTRRGASQSYGKEPDIIGLPGVHVEVKRVEKLNLSAAMEQAVRDSERFNDGMPVVFHRKNRESWLVTMRLDEWITIYERDNNKVLNQIFLMGRLIRDPELRQTNNGDSVATFTIAVDRDYSKEKLTDFIDCVAWKVTAEYVCKYFSKGSKVVVSGKLQLRDWVDKNDNKRRSAEVIVNSIYHADNRTEPIEESASGELPF